MESLRLNTLSRRINAPKPFKAPAHHGRAQSRCRDAKVRAGLFGFLGGGKAGGGKSGELVDELLSTLSTTGAKQPKEEISDLIGQLRQLRPRAPTKSPLFWGDFEVAYSTKPGATGGPLLGSAPGKVVFGFQRPRQSLQPSGELVQSVEYKTLGLIPGKRSQDGRISVIDGNRYEVQLDVRGEEVTRRFEVLYLDERIRIAQFLSDEEPEPVYFVFKRVQDEGSDQPEEDEQVAVPKVKPQKGTKKLAPRSAKPSQEDSQIATLTAALEEWQEKSKASAAQLREKERNSSGARRGAEPAKANLQKLQAEVGDLNQQLAEAVQAAQAAEGRYRQAVSELRDSERASR